MNLRPIPDYADMMTIAQFRDAIDCGTIFDDDGSGYYATESGVSEVPAVPSEIGQGFADERFTHVAWFNK